MGSCGVGEVFLVGRRAISEVDRVWSPEGERTTSFQTKAVAHALFFRRSVTLADGVFRDSKLQSLKGKSCLYCVRLIFCQVDFSIRWRRRCSLVVKYSKANPGVIRDFYASSGSTNNVSSDTLLLSPRDLARNTRQAGSERTTLENFPLIENL